MATVSFLNLDQAFSIANSSLIGFSSSDAANGGFQYSYLSTSGDWEFAGTGITSSGGVPTGGTVTNIELDIDNDGGSAEFSITGLGDVPIVNFGINSGTAAEQRDAFWAAALGGADSVDFTSAAYNFTLEFSGDGANISDGGDHVGASDTLSGGAQSLGGASRIIGDFYGVTSGSATGGNDLITVGALHIYADFNSVDVGVIAFGGNDTVTPNKIDANLSSILTIGGDAFLVAGALTGGDDLIDVRTTDFTGYSRPRIRLVGDIVSLAVGGVATGGDDTIHGSSLGDDIYGDVQANSGTLIGGNDLLFGYAGDDYFEGASGDDTIFGGIDNDTMLGGPGDDLLDGGAGSDSIAGGAGYDVASYQSATSLVRVALWSPGLNTGDAAGDTINFEVEAVEGSNFGDNLQGNSSNNDLRGAGGNDLILGGFGDDTLEGGSGADDMGGGAGFDIATYRHSSGAVSVIMSNPAANTGDAVGDNIRPDVEAVEGSGFNDLLQGNASNNELRGGDGADTLLGAFGDDTLEGGAGADSMVGGSGVDLVTYAHSTSLVRVALWDPMLNTGDAAGDTINFEVEIVEGSTFNDNIQGNASNNELRGGAGNDLILGGFGNDTLEGGAGADDMGGGAGYDIVSYANSSAGVQVVMSNPAANTGDAVGDNIRPDVEEVRGSAFADTLQGNASDNVFTGGLGNDSILGAFGNDTLSGQEGNDTLVGGAGNDVFTIIDGGVQSDVISDFSAGAAVSDVIRLLGFGDTLDTFGEVIAASSQNGADLLINLGGGQTLTLSNVTLGTLNANDFTFI